MTELEDRWRDLGAFIREQRGIGQLSLRKLSEMAGISNPYLSQIERGLRKPSAEILRQIAQALHISAETLYVRAGILEERDVVVDLVAEIRRDPLLNEEQKKTLVHIYEAFRAEQQAVLDAQLDQQLASLDDELAAAVAGDLTGGPSEDLATDLAPNRTADHQPSDDDAADDQAAEDDGSNDEPRNDEARNDEARNDEAGDRRGDLTGDPPGAVPAGPEEAPPASPDHLASEPGDLAASDGSAPRGGPSAASDASAPTGTSAPTDASASTDTSAPTDRTDPSGAPHGSGPLDPVAPGRPEGDHTLAR